MLVHLFGLWLTTGTIQNQLIDTNYTKSVIIGTSGCVLWQHSVFLCQASSYSISTTTTSLTTNYCLVFIPSSVCFTIDKCFLLAKSV